MGPTYKAVFIDWYGTLSISTFLGHWNRAGHPKQETYKQFESLWLGDLEPLLVPWMRGELVSEDFVQAASRFLEIDYEALMPEFIAGCECLQLISGEIAGRVRAIQELGMKVVIATDNMDCFSRGVLHYGECTLLLCDEMIQHRASVFEENTTIWHQKQVESGLKSTDWPTGFRANWGDRGKLAVVKLGSRIDANTPQLYANLLLEQRASLGGEDQFIEVHIWGPMTIRTVEQVTVSQAKRKHSPAILKDLRINLEKWGVRLKVQK